MRRFLPLLLLVTLLAACTAAPSLSDQPGATPSFVTATLPPTARPLPTSNSVPATPTTDPAIFDQLFPGSNADNELTRMDQQGMVIVELTPVNLGMPGDTLVFDVALNTHSVDLSMDLAQLATLTTDAGKTVQATLWDAPRGGHHVSGQLRFPVIVDGASLLEGATKITVEIKGVDAESRMFEWSLQ